MNLRKSAPRLVAAEILDHLDAGDPSAIRSRNDLLRIHHAMGTREIMRRGLLPLARPT